MHSKMKTSAMDKADDFGERLDESRCTAINHQIPNNNRNDVLKHRAVWNELKL